MNGALLRQRNFGLLWWAGLISIIGDWALRVALPIYVLRLTGSAAAVSGVVIAEMAGILLCGPFAGVHVDRWDRRRVVTIVNALQAVALLPLLAVDESGRVWIVLVVAFVESALGQFFMPAASALLPGLVAAEQLPAANAMNGLNSDIGRLAGPAAGGLVAAALGLRGATVLDAATFAAAFLLCSLITGRHRADRPDGRRHLGAEMLDGLRAVVGNRIVRAIVVAVTLGTIGEGMLGTLFAVFVTRALHTGAGVMGTLMSAQAIGGIAGGLVAVRVLHRFRLVPLAAVMLGAFGLIDLAIFNYPRVSTVLWPVEAMFVLVGLPASVAMAAVFTLLQSAVPDRLRGRVMATFMAMQAVAGIAGAGLAGALGDRFDVMTLLTVQGAGYVLAGGLLRLLAGPGPVAAGRPNPDDGVSAGATSAVSTDLSNTVT